MLNGDVLTDIDLTAQIAQHERTGATATLALTPVEDPSAYGLVRTRKGGEVTEFVEKPSPDQIDTQQHLRRRLRARARRCWSCSRPTSPPRSSATSSRASSATASTATCRTATGSTSGPRSATCEGTFDILEGTVASGVQQRMGDGYLCVEKGVENAGRIIPSALVESGCRIGEGARIGGRVVLERGVTVGEHTTIERAVVMQGAEIGSQLHDLAAASSRAACGSATSATSTA